MNAEHRTSLEEKRFVINPDSMGGMKRLRSTFHELQSEHPYLSGLGFFGSRTKGTEHESSDYDVAIFYNSDRMRGPADDRHPWGELTDIFKNTLRAELDHRATDPYGDLLIDLSREHTDRDLAVFMDITRPFLDKYTSEEEILNAMANRPCHNIISRFFLTVGLEVYANRQYIFNRLKELPENEGDEYFAMIMLYLGSFERGNEEGVITPSFTEYPQTIEEAERYFITR